MQSPKASAQQETDPLLKRHSASNMKRHSVTSPSFPSARPASQAAFDSTQTPALPGPPELPNITPLTIPQTIFRILRIVNPNFISIGTALIVVQFGCAALYAWSYNEYATLTGDFASAVTEKNGDLFTKSLISMILCCSAGALANALILCVGELLLLGYWRGRLIQYLHEKYLVNNAYFRLICVHHLIEDPDHRIAHEITQFLYKTKLIFFGTAMYAGLLPVIVSTTWFSYSLVEMTGWFILGGCFGFFLIFTVLNRLIMIPAAKASAEQARIESDFSFSHTYFRMHAEHVAFLGGADTERKKLNDLIDKASSHSKIEAIVHVPLNFSSNLFYWGIQCVAYLIPGAAWNYMGDEKLADVDNFITTQSLAYSLMSGLSTIILLSQDWSEWTALGRRLGELFAVLDFVSKPPPDDAEQNYAKTVNSQTTINFENVTILTPLNRTLLNNVTMKVTPECNVLIMGPSGIGKSSLLRALSGLWPIFAGSITRPPMEQILFLPQKPYFTLGTLREQITYPDVDLPLSDDDAFALLTRASLEHIAANLGPGYLDLQRNWSESLSVGEQQRLGIARVLFHKPKYAILDECTSAMDEDTEQAAYGELVRSGIAFLSVAHRSTVKKFHHWMLKIARDTTYILVPTEQQQSG